MGSMFADSDYGDTVETQLTLGTLSLLGIFFGLVMVCGIFFGFGYSIGRRNGASAANAALSLPARPAPVVRKSAQVTPDQTPQPASLPPVSAPSTPAAAPALPAAGSEPLLTAPSLTAAASPQSAASPAASSDSNNRAAAKTDSSKATSGATHVAPTDSSRILLNAKLRIPKPSAIQPSMEQTSTRIPLVKTVTGPQFPAQNLPSPYFVWTPPFDVRRSHGVTRRVYASVPRPAGPSASSPATATSSAPTYAVATYASAVRSMAPRASAGPPLVVQIAALSRQDDAEVLASALRERGFVPSIKSGSDDTLYHVQVGPFSREVAFATRQRLIAKGYNAVLK